MIFAKSFGKVQLGRANPGMSLMRFINAIGWFGREVAVHMGKKVKSCVFYEMLTWQGELLSLSLIRASR